MPSQSAARKLDAKPIAVTQLPPRVETPEPKAVALATCDSKCDDSDTTVLASKPEEQEVTTEAPRHPWAGELGEWKEAGDALALGRELFFREWQPNDPRSHGGDGLGPMYNETSCVACHNLGAPGGGGPAGKNVDILTLDDTRANAAMMGPIATTPDARAKIHEGLRTASSVVLHRFGTNEKYENWRLGLLAAVSGSSIIRGGDELQGLPASVVARVSIEQARNAQSNSTNAQRVVRSNRKSRSLLTSVTRSQRNTTALFGAGRIDTIPDDVLDAAAKVTHAGFPEVRGRVSRLADRRVGRFGWKAQTASLRDFALTACAVEVGLEVDSHPQGGDPLNPSRKPDGLDMNDEECDALVKYVGNLPQPTEVRPTNATASASILAGKELFTSIGCATCHVPKLGDVDGIYSDLLLHNMGSETADTGQYSPFRPSSPGFAGGSAIANNQCAPASSGLGTLAGASREDWRTPPLWGVRDSAPYLHDGRAETLEEAIALHDGEGQRSGQRYFELAPNARNRVLAFLKSLAAPTETPQVGENPAGN
jgi:CxxC motif-containing protein (DUF1111 family)